MKTFWNWVRSKQEARLKLAEAVQQQQQRIVQILQQKFPNLSSMQINQLFSTLIEMENLLTDEEDKRKSATVSKFLRSYQHNPADSAAHTIDRFKRELQAEVQKSNAKGKTPQQLADMMRQELMKRLPGESPKIIDYLLGQIQQGARLNDVVNAYLSKKNAVGSEDKIVHQEGSLEMIEINLWREDGTMDKHLDKNKGMQACHPLFKGTKWCVRFQDYFNEYAKSGPLYLIRDNGRPLILGHKNSEWLDTEDDPPNPTLMEKLSPFILNAGIASVAIKTVAYLPNPIQDTEAYIQSGKYKRQTATAMRAHLTGSDYEYENGVCVLADFGNLQETLEGLRNLGQNRINVDLDSIESRVEEAVSEQPTDLQDLVDSLDSQNKDRIIDILNKRYSEGYYGEIDGWDDMDLHKSIKYDEEIVQALTSAASFAMTDETMDRIIKSITNDLRHPDEAGFYVDEKWRLCIPADSVNEIIKTWIQDGTPPGSGDGYEDESIGSQMAFTVEEPEIALHFSSKLYNSDIRRMPPLYAGN
jgi:hypothetical protein